MKQYERDCLINTELSDQDKKELFNLKEKKFLHNIDTFYYSVTFYNDFSKESEDYNVEKLRRYFSNLSADAGFDCCIPVFIPGMHKSLNFRGLSYSGYYKYCLESPEEFDIFIAEHVPTDVTAQMIVQIRSNLLWTVGANRAFEKSYAIVEKLAEHFGLQIQEVKENRIDYCWHTNYVQRPDLFFRPDKFAEMEVSRFKRVTFQYQLKKINNEIESDYIALGSRGDKCFVRFYLKSKEVIEMNYKAYFLKLWLLNDMISRYDFYVYEKLYLTGKWINLDKCRLEFYLEYGQNEFYKQQIKQLFEADTPNYKSIRKLADILTPPVTLILNVEFQTTRKSTKSYTLVKLRDNERYGVACRIYDYLDNRQMITDYLTDSTLRLVDCAGDDSNKSRAPYCAFWERLRNTKQVDVHLSKHNIKLIRDYSRQLNKDVVKTRMCNSIVTYSLYCKGKNQDDVEDDVIGSIVRLNDNDMHKMRRYKSKRLLQLNNQDFNGSIDNIDADNVNLINTETGEALW